MSRRDRFIVACVDLGAAAFCALIAGYFYARRADAWYVVTPFMFYFLAWFFHDLRLLKRR